MEDFIPVKEAARELGYRGDSALYKLAETGTITLVDHEVNGQRRKVVSREDLEMLRERRSHRLPKEPDSDGLMAALSDLEAAVRAVRRAVRGHDAEVRREAVTTFVDTLKEGIR